MTAAKTLTVEEYSERVEKACREYFELDTPRSDHGIGESLVQPSLSQPSLAQPCLAHSDSTKASYIFNGKTYT